MAPIPCLRPALLLKLHELPPHLWTPTLYALYGEGNCTEDEIASFELLSQDDRARLVKSAIGGLPAIATEKAPVKRRKGLSRQERTMRRPRFMGLRYVRRIPLDPFLYGPLSSGAKTTLLYLIARAGKTRAFAKRTCLVATDLGIAQRTLQTHYVALEQAGFIARGAVDPVTGATPIRITEACEPPAFKKREDAPAVDLAEGAQDSALTQPIKEDSRTTYVEPENRGDAERESSATAVPSSQEPGAVLSRPAQPRAHALGGEEVLNRAFIQNREAQRDPERRKSAGLTPFDGYLDAILVRIAVGKPESKPSNRSDARRPLDSRNKATAGPPNRVSRR